MLFWEGNGFLWILETGLALFKTYQEKNGNPEDVLLSIRKKRHSGVPCSEIILRVANRLENYRGGTFLCQRHLCLEDVDPLITSHKLYVTHAARKVIF